MKGLCLYASLWGNHETELLAPPGYFTMQTRGNFNVNERGRISWDWSEMHGVYLQLEMGRRMYRERPS